MNAFYKEVSGTAAFVKEQFGFLANTLWLRHIGGSGTIEVSITTPFDTTQIKLSDITTGTHPNEVEIGTVEGVSTIAVKGNGLTLAVRATQ